MTALVNLSIRHQGLSLGPPENSLDDGSSSSAANSVSSSEASSSSADASMAAGSMSHAHEEGGGAGPPSPAEPPHVVSFPPNASTGDGGGGGGGGGLKNRVWLSRLQHLDLTGNPLAVTTLFDTSCDAPATAGLASGDSNATLRACFPSLHTLRLSNTQLTGSLPDLSAATSWQLIDLSFNALSGAIPMSWWHAPNLTRISLGMNELSGTLPAALTSWSYLDVSGNLLSGDLPTSVVCAGNAVCEVLNLADNLFNSSLESMTGAWVAATIILSGNYGIRGRLASATMAWMASPVYQLGASHPLLVDVSYCDITGPIPAQWLLAASHRGYQMGIAVSGNARFGDLFDNAGLSALSSSSVANSPLQRGALWLLQADRIPSLTIMSAVAVEQLLAYGGDGLDTLTASMSVGLDMTLNIVSLAKVPRILDVSGSISVVVAADATSGTTTNNRPPTTALATACFVDVTPMSTIGATDGVATDELPIMPWAAIDARESGVPFRLHNASACDHAATSSASGFRQTVSWSAWTAMPIYLDVTAALVPAPVVRMLPSVVGGPQMVWYRASMMPWEAGNVAWHNVTRWVGWAPTGAVVVEIPPVTAARFNVPYRLSIAFGSNSDAFHGGERTSPRPLLRNRCLDSTQLAVPGTTVCVPCPDHGICDGSSVMQAKSGFWRPSNAFLPLRRCNPAEACGLGDDAEDEHESRLGPECAEGHEGIMCAGCVDGYASVDGKCQACATIQTSLVAIVLLALFMFGTAGLIIVSALRKLMTKEDGEGVGEATDSSSSDSDEEVTTPTTAAAATSSKSPTSPSRRPPPQPITLCGFELISASEMPHAVLFTRIVLSKLPGVIKVILNYASTMQILGELNGFKTHFGHGSAVSTIFRTMGIVGLADVFQSLPFVCTFGADADFASFWWQLGGAGTVLSAGLIYVVVKYLTHTTSAGDANSHASSSGVGMAVAPAAHSPNPSGNGRHPSTSTDPAIAPRHSSSTAAAVSNTAIVVAAASASPPSGVAARTTPARTSAAGSSSAFDVASLWYLPLTVLACTLQIFYEPIAERTVDLLAPCRVLIFQPTASHLNPKVVIPSAIVSQLSLPTSAKAFNVLSSSMEVSCLTPAAHSAFSAAQLVFGLLLIAAPVAIYLLGSYIRAKEGRRGLDRVLGFLSEEFVEATWYWELALMLRKLALTMLVVFLRDLEDTLLLMLLTIWMVSAVVNEYHRPYKNPWLHRTEHVFLMTAYATTFLNALTRFGAPASNISTMLIFTQLLGILSLIFALVAFMNKHVKRYRKLTAEPASPASPASPRDDDRLSVLSIDFARSFLTRACLAACLVSLAAFAVAGVSISRLQSEAEAAKSSSSSSSANVAPAVALPSPIARNIGKVRVRAAGDFLVLHSASELPVQMVDDLSLSNTALVLQRAECWVSCGDAKNGFAVYAVSSLSPGGGSDGSADNASSFAPEPLWTAQGDRLLWIHSPTETLLSLGTTPTSADGEVFVKWYDLATGTLRSSLLISTHNEGAYLSAVVATGQSPIRSELSEVGSNQPPLRHLDDIATSTATGPGEGGLTMFLTALRLNASDVLGVTVETSVVVSCQVPTSVGNTTTSDNPQGLLYRLPTAWPAATALSGGTFALWMGQAVAAEAKSSDAFVNVTTTGIPERSTKKVTLTSRERDDLFPTRNNWTAAVATALTYDTVMLNTDGMRWGPATSDQQLISLVGGGLAAFEANENESSSMTHWQLPAPAVLRLNAPGGSVRYVHGGRGGSNGDGGGTAAALLRWRDDDGTPQPPSSGNGSTVNGTSITGPPICGRRSTLWFVALGSGGETSASPLSVQVCEPIAETTVFFKGHVAMPQRLIAAVSPAGDRIHLVSVPFSTLPKVSVATREILRIPSGCAVKRLDFTSSVSDTDDGDGQDVDDDDLAPLLSATLSCPLVSNNNNNNNLVWVMRVGAGGHVTFMYGVAARSPSHRVEVTDGNGSFVVIPRDAAVSTSGGGSSGGAGTIWYQPSRPHGRDRVRRTSAADGAENGGEEEGGNSGTVASLPFRIVPSACEGGDVVDAASALDPMIVFVGNVLAALFGIATVTGCILLLVGDLLTTVLPSHSQAATSFASAGAGVLRVATLSLPSIALAAGYIVSMAATSSGRVFSGASSPFPCAVVAGGLFHPTVAIAALSSNLSSSSACALVPIGLQYHPAVSPVFAYAALGPGTVPTLAATWGLPTGAITLCSFDREHDGAVGIIVTTLIVLLAMEAIVAAACLFWALFDPESARPFLERTPAVLYLLWDRSSAFLTEVVRRVVIPAKKTSLPPPGAAKGAISVGAAAATSSGRTQQPTQKVAPTSVHGTSVSTAASPPSVTGPGERRTVPADATATLNEEALTTAAAAEATKGTALHNVVVAHHVSTSSSPPVVSSAASRAPKGTPAEKKGNKTECSEVGGLALVRQAINAPKMAVRDWDAEGGPPTLVGLAAVAELIVCAVPQLIVTTALLWLTIIFSDSLSAWMSQWAALALLVTAVFRVGLCLSQERLHAAIKHDWHASARVVRHLSKPIVARRVMESMFRFGLAWATPLIIVILYAQVGWPAGLPGTFMAHIFLASPPQNAASSCSVIGSELRPSASWVSFSCLSHVPTKPPGDNISADQESDSNGNNSVIMSIVEESCRAALGAAGLTATGGALPVPLPREAEETESGGDDHHKPLNNKSSTENRSRDDSLLAEDHNANGEEGDHAEEEEDAYQVEIIDAGDAGQIAIAPCRVAIAPPLIASQLTSAIALVSVLLRLFCSVPRFALAVFSDHPPLFHNELFRTWWSLVLCVLRPGWLPHVAAAGHAWSAFCNLGFALRYAATEAMAIVAASVILLNLSHSESDDGFTLRLRATCWLTVVCSALVLFEGTAVDRWCSTTHKWRTTTTTTSDGCVMDEGISDDSESLATALLTEGETSGEGEGEDLNLENRSAAEGHSFVLVN